MEKKYFGEAIKILIVDDHKMVRDGLKIMFYSLRKHMKFQITQADSGEDAILKLAENDFDLVLLDYQMSGVSGTETIYRIMRFKPDTKILGLSNYDELSYAQSMIDAGANGYILKTINPSEMLNAVRTVLDGRLYYSNEIALKLMDANEIKKIVNDKIESLLSHREAEVLRLIGMEYTNEEIGEILRLSKRTVDSHRQSLIRKLHVKNTAGLVKAAYKLKLIEL